ncbi:OPT family oligopeptide transporter [Pelosinus propionicus]|uniref:Putative oligopeptide transporter, OPT family n=1 Tax=Pelosinus propionicus DSM 13327 TaxID=1123291 RepID=A0A1I4NTU0_9FIRM|nr:oligopeptide transporter, OPT family [Pelosinus propionicus]SFM18889.1 putative oligopeptide transporter, OPT family [Pelosinus propionicus DSM 13327]
MAQSQLTEKLQVPSEQEEPLSALSDNAFTPLQEGEEYEPILSPYKEYKEVTVYSAALGILLGAIFTVAATYMPLKIGQGVTSDVPIAAIGIGLAAVLGRKNVLGENTLMQCIGSTGSMVNSGVIFVMPALFILQLQVSYNQLVWTTIMGGVLGIAFAIILRNYFVVHMHGQYPFPGSLSTTEILLSGAKGGDSLRILIYSSIVGGLADFATNSFGWWNSIFTSRFCAFGEQLASKHKVLFAVDIESVVVAMGYMTGLRYAAIIAAGSMFGWWCLIPFLNFFADGQTIAVGTNIVKLIKDMSPEEIFRNYVRFIGIGTLAMAGILGVIKMAPFIGIAFKEALVGIIKTNSHNGEVLRTRRDLPMSWVVGAVAAVGVVFAILIKAGYADTWLQSIAITFVLIIGGFLFSVVGTTSIAFTASEPVSGLTLLTLIIGAQAMVSTGLIGNAGIMVVLLMCSVVCSCLFMTGCFVGDLKAAFWLGITPKKMQIWKLVNVVFSAFIAAGVILVLASSFGFSGPGSLVAPQANAIAAVIDPLMSGQSAPWVLYLVGAVLAICLDMMKVPALAFGLGLYMPLALTIPLLVGGIISYVVSHRSDDALLNKLRQHRGVLVSSGFIAGGSLLGVLSACLRVMGYDFTELPWGHTDNPEIWSLVMYVLLCSYYIWYAAKPKSCEE